MLCSGFAAFQTARMSFGSLRMTLRFANGVLGLANGNIKHLFGELDRITRTFGHEASMPQFSGYFETETLPSICFH